MSYFYKGSSELNLEKCVEIKNYVVVTIIKMKVKYLCTEYSILWDTCNCKICLG